MVGGSALTTTAGIMLDAAGCDSMTACNDEDEECEAALGCLGDPGKPAADANALDDTVEEVAPDGTIREYLLKNK